jgi:hypothetical protein
MKLLLVDAGRMGRNVVGVKGGLRGAAVPLKYSKRYRFGTGNGARRTSHSSFLSLDYPARSRWVPPRDLNADEKGTTMVPDGWT